MIELSNIRIEDAGEWTRLVSDINVTGFENPFDQKTMWFAVKSEYADMFWSKNYNAFFLVPLYLGMYYGSDVRIKGSVSRELYRNMMDYGQQILCNFSPALKKIKVYVDNQETIEFAGKLVGTGISCGVDSLSTVYDRFAKEADADYRINSLFIFNCGTHGHYEDVTTRRRFLGRYELNSMAARELGLPVYLVDTNLHAFTHKIAEQKLGYLAIYSCILSLQKCISKYYIASSYSYNEILKYHEQSHDFDMAEFADTYLVPLLQTETVRIVLDGAQYRRSQKTANIAEWEIAQKYLNVCINPVENAKNCSQCSKCMRTLIALEAIGKINEFEQVFDLDAYWKAAHKNKVMILSNYGKEGFATDNVDFAREHGMKLPEMYEVNLYRLVYLIKVHGRAILGNRIYDKIKDCIIGFCKR